MSLQDRLMMWSRCFVIFYSTCVTFHPCSFCLSHLYVLTISTCQFFVQVNCFFYRCPYARGQTSQRCAKIAAEFALHWTSRWCQARWNIVKDVRRCKQTERETGMCFVSAESFWFSLFDAARDTLPTQHVSYLTSWEWDSTISCLCGAFRNSWDKSYWFYLQL